MLARTWRTEGPGVTLGATRPGQVPTAGSRTGSCLGSPGSVVTSRLREILAVVAAVASILCAGAARPGLAQTAQEVPTDWGLAPSGLSAGDSFRLLLVTSTTRNGRPTAIANYDSHVQDAVAAGHADIQDYSTHFKALGSTETVNARDHTGTTHTTSDPGLPIYWLNGSKVADDYADFYDGDWDSNSATKEDGNAAATGAEVYTGSNDDGTVFDRRYLGTDDGNSVRIGKPGTSGEEIDSGGNKNKSNQLPYYGLSGVFTLVAPPPPELVSAEVDGAELVLTYNEALDDTSEPAAGQFTVTVDGSAGVVSSVDISGSAVTLTLAAAVEAQQTVTVDYAVPASNPLQNGDGTAAEALTGQAVTNRTAAEVQSSWSLAPSGLDVGDSFRLLLVTSTTRNGRPTAIADYDSHVQDAVAAGHADIQDYSTHFKALGSTENVNARDHTGTTHTTSDPGLPIYWLNGSKVADDYADFYDGDWDSNSATKEDGNAAATGAEVYTGSNDDGTVFDRRYLGTDDGNSVRIGKPGTSGEEIDSGGNKNKSNQLPYYGLSGVFTLVAPRPPELVSAEVDGAELVLTYNEALDDTSEPAAGQFTATVNGALRLVSSVDISGSAVKLTLAAGAAAMQTVTVNYVVPASNPLQNEEGVAAEALTRQAVANRTAAVALTTWSLVPSSLSVGESFRLLFVTSTTRNGRVTDIATYDQFVQDAAAAGHADIQAYSAHFKVLGSTQTINARDHTGTTHTTSDLGVPIYWLGGSKAADDYSDFYDGTWDSNSATLEDGTAATAGVEVYTGSNSDGTIYDRRYLGTDDGNSVRIGKPDTSGEEIDSGGNKNRTNQLGFYGLSEVFIVRAPPNVAPVLSTAEVDGAELVLTYDEALDEGSEPAASAYTVTVAGVARAVSDVDVIGTDVTLTLASAVQAGQTVTVSYAVPTTNPVQDPGGLGAAALTDQAVTNTTGAVAPMLSTAEVDGAELVLTYDEALDETSEPSTSAYTVTVDGAALEVSSVDVTGTKVTLTLASAVQAGQTVTVSYAVPATNPVQDPGGTDAAALTDQAVTNNTAAVAPMLSTAVVDGIVLVLTYDEALDEASEPAASAYTVTVDGAALGVSSVDVTGTQVTLMLASAVQADQTVTVSYAVPATNPVQDVGGTGAGALTNQAVTNATPGPVTVASSWGLVPAGLGQGDSFRLLFVTSTTRNGRVADIARYDQFVQDAAAAGHADIQAHSAHFKVLGSTQTINASDHTGTTHTATDPGVPIYWLDGSKAADDYADFYDGDWDSNSATQEDGAAAPAGVEVYTGSNSDGTIYERRYIGTDDGNAVRIGKPGASGEEIDSGGNKNRTNQLGFYGLSGVFTVGAALVRALTTVTLAADLDDFAETSGTVVVTVTATLAMPRSADTELELHVRDGSATAPEDFTANPNIVALTIPAGQQAGTASFALSPEYEQDGDPECDEDLIVGGRSAVQGGASVIVLPTRITLTDPDVDPLRCMVPVGRRPIRLEPKTDPDPLEPPELEPETGPDPPEAAAEPPPTPAKVALWTDRTAYIEGQPVRLYRSLHPMGDDSRYTIFYYLQRRGARRHFYFAPEIRSTELEEAIVDQSGFGEGSFQAGPIRAVGPELIWAGAPRTAGLWQFVAEVRTADAAQVVKTAYAKFTVTAAEFTEVGSDGLPTSVSTDQTWTSDTVYRLRHEVRVRPGATLTLERGTLILGRGPDAAIIVERGAKINAAGTRTSPVVMTCDARVGHREPGCWRGLAVLGSAPASGGSGADPTESREEGPFGGEDPDDSSGTLRFVRVEFAGGSRDPHGQPAAISLRGVGAGTVLNHLQAHESLGDGIEFRGGTAHCAHCVSSGAREDLLAWSGGWTGGAKHVFLQQGLEGGRGIDVRGRGERSSPPQRPAVHNMTAVGGAADGRPGPTGSGIALGPATGLTASNLVVTGFAGLAIEAARGAAATFLDGRSSIRNAILFQNGGRYGVAQIGLSVSPYVEFVDRDPKLVNARYEANPDPRPTEGSAALRADVPADGTEGGRFAPDERFLGAFGMTNWLVEWTFFGPESDYRTAGPTGGQP